MRNLQAVILAAGEGTRMKSDRPKVLHGICGRPMIAYALDLVTSAGVKQPIIVLGHGAEDVKARLPREARVVIQGKRLGTGDAVATAKKLLGGSGAVLVLYADTPLLRRTTVQRLIEAHFKTGATCSLLTAHLADPTGYGRILRNEGGQISGIVEEAEANAAQRAIREINVGPLICNAQALLAALATVKPSASKHELYLTDIVSHLARQEGTKIQAARVEEIAEALGINSRSELARAIGVIRQRIIETHLHNGVTIEDPDTTAIDYGVSIGADTVIHPYTVIETGVSVGKRCELGPFARLRTGVALGEAVRVGNFAELVRAKVGSRTRINHFSYLGDVVVEEDVNIGAGTVTANYDGQAKHQTHIGKGAFIGSDSILVAPVKIGAGAVTGAGCVVTKAHDVPPKGVVVGVPARPLGHPAATDNREPSPEGGAKPPANAERVAPARRRDGEVKAKPAARRRPVRKAAKAAAGRPGLRRRLRPAPRRRAQGAKRPTRTKAVRRRPAAKRRKARR